MNKFDDEKLGFIAWLLIVVFGGAVLLSYVYQIYEKFK